MNKPRLLTLMAGAAMAVGLAFAGSAAADGANANDFTITEQLVNGEFGPFGQYTVTNNSADWYIYAFAVTNPAFGEATTDRSEWEAGSFCSDCGDGGFGFDFIQLAGRGFAYQDFTFVSGSGFGNPIGPGETSSQFLFYANLASNWQINVFQQNGPQDVVFGSIGGIPEPATWGLMITGFGLAGASLRRRRQATA